jgi:hypothetical protein
VLYYTVHLTFGKTCFGLTSEELNGYRAEKELIPNLTFKVNFSRVHQEIEAKKYIKYLDISPFFKELFLFGIVTFKTEVDCNGRVQRLLWEMREG